MELRHLRYFVAVAEQRHFGRAAERLHMAQPPLSQQIRQLEAELGVTLLTRTTRRVDLTPAGASYLEHARDILAAVDAAGEAASRIAAGRTGRLTVGCVGSATYSLLPALAKALRGELPDVEFGFRGEMLSPEQAAALHDGSLDLALLRRPPDTAGLTVSTVRRERLLVAVPQEHRYAGRRRLRVADLAGEGLIVHAGGGRSVMNALVHDLFGTAQLGLEIVHEVAETSTLVTFVAAGLGVAVVPEPTSALNVPGVVYVPLVGTPGVDLVVATREGDANPVLTRALARVSELGRPGHRRRAPRAPMLRDMVHASGARALGSVIAAAEAASPVEAVEAVTRELGRALGASEVSFLIADLSGRALVRLAHVPLRDSPLPRAQGERRDAEESATTVPFDGGPEEQAIRVQQVQVLGPEHQDGGAKRAGHWRVLAPVTERGEAIGLLELFVPSEPDAETVAEIAQLAHVLAFVVIANRRHTDLYEWGQRTRPLSLSAEIQHRLLAGPQTCEAGAFTLAGWLEPAAAIAGDTFDFSLARDELHLSITDAMGHGVAAALNATLCIGSLRNTRNEGALLLDQVAAANQALAAHAISSGLEDFVTGLIGRLDLRTGSIELVNAGHVAPYLSRGSDVRPIELPVDVPLGLFPDTVYRSTKVTLENDDRLVMVTDGMLERHAAGLDLAQEIRATRSLHPREAVRALADRVLEVAGGDLSDDATVVCLDWYGGHGHDRSSRHGADFARASPPRS